MDGTTLYAVKGTEDVNRPDTPPDGPGLTLDTSTPDDRFRDSVGKPEPWRPTRVCAFPFLHPSPSTEPPTTGGTRSTQGSTATRTQRSRDGRLSRSHPGKRGETGISKTSLTGFRVVEDIDLGHHLAPRIPRILPRSGKTSRVPPSQRTRRRRVFVADLTCGWRVAPRGGSLPVVQTSSSAHEKRTSGESFFPSPKSYDPP